MTIEQFNEYNKTNAIPYEWIGQGYGYKDFNFDWEKGNPTDIIYIPENGYDGKLGEEYVERGCAYSKQDFLDICNGIDDAAHDLFCAVDWQFPTTLFNEGWCDEYFEEEKGE